MNLFNMQFFQPCVTSSLLGPNIVLSILFSHTHNLYPSFGTRDQVAHPCKVTGKVNSSLYFNPKALR